jgi:hypothetical protein
MTTNHKFGFLFTALILAISVAACGGGSSASNAGKPEDAAKAMFDTLFAGKDIASMLCSSQQSQASTIKDTFSRLADANATVDTSGLTYTASDVSGDTAKVTVGGKLKVTVSGTSKEVAFPNIPLPMKNENGWKACA